MDLRTHFPYSLLCKSIINSYPSLQQHIHCDVAVIGAGITGVLIAWHPRKAGIDTAVFDKRHTGIRLWWKRNYIQCDCCANNNTRYTQWQKE